MGKSLTDVAKTILSENANAATLKPMSKQADAPSSLGGATKIADAPDDGSGTNVGAAAAAPVKKMPKRIADKDGTSEPAKKSAMAEELEDEGNMVAESEEIEMSEELTSFIDQMIEEGASEDEIAAAIEENFEVVEEVIEEEVEEESYQVDMAEHVEALLAGEELSEEFKEKAKVIFEAAVKQKVQEEIARLEEAYAETLEEQIAEIETTLSENVDSYLNYVVENWVQDNEVAIQAGLRSELTEDFISGLRNLFSEHYIDIPEDKISVVEEMASKIEALEEKLNEEIERNVELNGMINEARQYEVLDAACDGLTDTQAAKLKTLAEGLDYSSVDEFSQKINLLRENYFRTSVNNSHVLDEVQSADDGRTMISEELNGPMAKYVKALGKVTK